MIKAIRKTIEFSSTIKVDGYLIPPNEFRIGVTGASTSLGYSKQWLTTVHTRGGKTLELLHSIGYDGSRINAEVTRVQGGVAIAQTISLSDYNILIEYAVDDRKKQAKALSRALREVSLDTRLRREFGIQEMPGWLQELKMREIIESVLGNEEIREQFLPGDKDCYDDTLLTSHFEQSIEEHEIYTL